MEIRFDNHSTEEFFEWMAKKVSELSIPLLKQSLESEIEGEVLLGRKEVCDQVLNCSVDTADKHFLYRIGKKPVQFCTDPQKLDFYGVEKSTPFLYEKIKY